MKNIASRPAARRLACVLTLTLGGCTVGPDWTAPKWASPASWFRDGDAPPVRKASVEISRPTAAPIDAQWWRAFHDPELTSLVERVAAANLDVRIQTIRIAESRAQRGVAASALFPSVNGNASYTRERLSQKGAISLLSGGSSGGGGSGGSSGSSGSGGSGSGGSGSSNPASAFGGGGLQTGAFPSSVTGGTKIPPIDIFQYGFDASWEPDLWGRVARSVESADASEQAAEETRRDTLLSSIAEVARDYLQLRGTQTQIAIARENLKTAQSSLDLTRQRAQGGLVTDLDVQNAAAQVDTNAAQIPQLEQQEAQQINALSLLLGLQPAALRDELGKPALVPPVPPTVPVGLPGELARRRPDIRQAEAQLHSATAEIGVAVADFYPQVTLSGSFSIQALQIRDLSNWAARQYGLGPSISLPIFQGGRLRATLELRKAQQQEAAVTYQRTLLAAWHDVDNALVAYDAEQRRREGLARAVDSNRRAVGLAQSRYTQGLTDFLQVLDAERSLLASQQDLATSTTNISTNLVAIYKALGGGWEGDYPDLAGVKEARAG